VVQDGSVRAVVQGVEVGGVRVPGSPVPGVVRGGGERVAERGPGSGEASRAPRMGRDEP
jgi:hypothetical protein